MKKITLIAFALGALSLASCKKARTCNCTSTLTTVTTLSGTINSSSTITDPPYSSTEVLASATKKTAQGKKTCNSRIEKQTSSYIVGSQTTKNEYSDDITCTIK